MCACVHYVCMCALVRTYCAKVCMNIQYVCMRMCALVRTSCAKGCMNIRLYAYVRTCAHLLRKGVHEHTSVSVCAHLCAPLA